MKKPFEHPYYWSVHPYRQSEMTGMDEHEINTGFDTISELLETDSNKANERVAEILERAGQTLG